MTPSKPIVIISCGVFKPELDALCKQGKITHPVIFLKSRFHMFPEKLQKTLEKLVDKERSKGNRILLIYGDCQPYMDSLETEPDVSRTAGINCPSILLGKEKYSQLQREGAFMLLSEWTMQWKEIFHGELGLTKETAKSFMQDMLSKLVYCDTGTTPVPEDNLQEISKYAGLPIEVLPVAHTELLKNINKALNQLKDESR